jgi:hypothetical protein
MNVQLNFLYNSLIGSKALGKHLGCEMFKKLKNTIKFSLGLFCLFREKFFMHTIQLNFLYNSIIGSKALGKRPGCQKSKKLKYTI